MKKTIRKVTVLALTALMVLTLAACGGGFDAQQYVQWELDSAIINANPDEYLEAYDGEYTLEDMEAFFYDSLEMDKDYLFDMTTVYEEDLTEETIQRARDLLEAAYKTSDYVVGEAQENGDGFLVPVTVTPSNVLIDTVTTELLDAMLDDYINGTYDTTQDREEAYTAMLLDALEANIAAPTYGDPIEVNVHVELVGEVYDIDDDDFNQIALSVLPFGVG